MKRRIIVKVCLKSEFMQLILGGAAVSEYLTSGLLLIDLSL